MNAKWISFLTDIQVFINWDKTHPTPPNAIRGLTAKHIPKKRAGCDENAKTTPEKRTTTTPKKHTAYNENATNTVSKKKKTNMPEELDFELFEDEDLIREIAAYENLEEGDWKNHRVKVQGSRHRHHGASLWKVRRNDPNNTTANETRNDDHQDNNELNNAAAGEPHDVGHQGNVDHQDNDASNETRNTTVGFGAAGDEGDDHGNPIEEIIDDDFLNDLYQQIIEEEQSGI